MSWKLSVEINMTTSNMNMNMDRDMTWTLMWTGTQTWASTSTWTYTWTWTRTYVHILYFCPWPCSSWWPCSWVWILLHYFNGQLSMPFFLSIDNFQRLNWRICRQHFTFQCLFSAEKSKDGSQIYCTFNGHLSASVTLRTAMINGRSTFSAYNP
jgi:hypothetical protein